MTASDHLRPGSFDTESVLERAIDRFEQAWMEGRTPSIEEYLSSAESSDDAQRRQLLRELVLIDMECRWRRWGLSPAPAKPSAGLPEQPQAEDYLRDFADLRRSASIATDLICEEYRVRQRFGDKPGHREFLERFAEQAESLRTLLSAVDADRLRERVEGRGLPNVAGPRRRGEEFAADANGEMGSAPDIFDPLEETKQVDALAETRRDDVIGSDSRESLIVKPEYDRLNFHAEGGLGEVFLARDVLLHRDLALKFIRKDHAYDLDSRTRFLLEAEVTARLEHPGVVPVYCMGNTSEERPFYAMRFIQGETLEEAIRRLHAEQHKLTGKQYKFAFRDLLNRFVSVCNTLAYAHNRGIVHRDVKPENVMLGRYGETLIVDWGLAVPVGRDERARASGERTLKPSGEGSASDSGGPAGTPAYMSPEQADGNAELTVASDIFNLGATLYKLLTGNSPFRGRDVGEILDNVRRGRFERPSEMRRGIPPPLEAICLKAMAREPEARYSSALELAADIEHWLADEPVAVYREPWAHRLARWARRHRSWALAAMAAGAAILLILATSAVLLGRMAQSERSARTAAEEARERGLRMAARFAAKTVASEIDLRWRILEAEAADAQLRSLLTGGKPAGDDLPAEELANWLNKRYIEHFGSTKATSWFITDDEGVQLARTPKPERNTIGKSYRWRDYFHGAGRDLTEQEASDEEPILHVHRSTVFRSQANGNLMVAYSVPIRGTDDSDPIGVLAMTVELGEFSVLQAGLGPNQLAVLVETKEDSLENGPRKGLILHHRRFRELRRTLSDEQLPVFRIDPRLVGQLERLRSTRMRPGGFEDSSTWEPRDDEIRRDYRDPVATGHVPESDQDERWLAAFEPVFVKGRTLEKNRDIGWVVIVQERQLAPRR